MTYMLRAVVEHRLRDVQHRLVRAREEMAVLDEQLAFFQEEADDARIRSLVSETPLAEREWVEAERHAEAMRKSHAAIARSVAELEQRRDELLARLPARPWTSQI